MLVEKESEKEKKKTKTFAQLMLPKNLEEGNTTTQTQWQQFLPDQEFPGASKRKECAVGPGFVWLSF